MMRGWDLQKSSPEASYRNSLKKKIIIMWKYPIKLNIMVNMKSSDPLKDAHLLLVYSIK